MTDRELLELAAKACGWSLFYYGSHCTAQVAPGRLLDWNPLEEDGDAFRLMVDLELIVGHDINDKVVYATVRNPYFCAREFYGGTSSAPNDATRRAIVRAAAEIGKGMK